MQVTGMLHGAKLLQFAGFPTTPGRQDRFIPCVQQDSLETVFLVDLSKRLIAFGLPARHLMSSRSTCHYPVKASYSLTKNCRARPHTVIPGLFKSGFATAAVTGRCA